MFDVNKLLSAPGASGQIATEPVTVFEAAKMQEVSMFPKLVTGKAGRR